MNFNQSLFRQHTNRLLQKNLPELNGIVVDLGSAQNSNYHRFSPTPPFSLDIQGKPSVIANLEKKFPLQSNSVDTITAFNLFEHLFLVQQTIQECYLTLKPGGKILILTPFLKDYHPNPEDYFRFTTTAWQKITKQTGFTQTRIQVVGEGPFEVIYDQLMQFMPKPSLPLIWFFCFLGTLVIKKFKPHLIKKYPLGIWVEAIK